MVTLLCSLFHGIAAKYSFYVAQHQKCTLWYRGSRETVPDFNYIWLFLLVQRENEKPKLNTGNSFYFTKENLVKQNLIFIWNGESVSGWRSSTHLYPYRVWAKVSC